MKLIMCNKCLDIFNLNKELKTCSCGEASGKYIDNINAEIFGDCTHLGFANNSFKAALRIDLTDQKWGTEFIAFVIPPNVPSIKHINPSQKVK